MLASAGEVWSTEEENRELRKQLERLGQWSRLESQNPANPGVSYAKSTHMAQRIENQWLRRETMAAMLKASILDIQTSQNSTRLPSGNSSGACTPPCCF